MIGFKNVVSEFKDIITRYEPTLLSTGAVHDAVAIESVAATDKLVTTDELDLVSLTAIGLFEQLIYDCKFCISFVATETVYD